MKTRYWKETTATEFYELWPETDRNKLEMVIVPDDVESELRFVPDHEMEDYLYGDVEDDDE